MILTGTKCFIMQMRVTFCIPIPSHNICYGLVYVFNNLDIQKRVCCSLYVMQCPHKIYHLRTKHVCFARLTIFHIFQQIPWLALGKVYVSLHVSHVCSTYKYNITFLCKFIDTWIIIILISYFKYHLPICDYVIKFIVIFYPLCSISMLAIIIFIEALDLN